MSTYKLGLYCYKPLNLSGVATTHKRNAFISAKLLSYGPQNDSFLIKTLLVQKTKYIMGWPLKEECLVDGKLKCCLEWPKLTCNITFLKTVLHISYYLITLLFIFIL